MKINSFYIILLSVVLSSCSKAPQPKPYAYFRIDIPEHQYVTTFALGPYSTEINALCYPDSSDNRLATAEDKWINLKYPTLNAIVHLSYKRISPGIFHLVSEECRTLAYKNTVCADAITESFFADDSTSVYGILYEMQGNAASPSQFFVTDSTNNFLRGSLYFNHTPNADSIAPAANYILQDMIHIIETLNWK